MSERKSAEIKFRCTPSFKASLASSAEAAGQSMSEYIEAAVWATPNTRLTGNATVDAAIATELRPIPAEALLVADDLAVIAAELEDDEPPVDADGNAVACTCRPWEFCTHKVVG